jgi:hypothetical protein
MKLDDPLEDEKEKVQTIRIRQSTNNNEFIREGCQFL